MTKLTGLTPRGEMLLEYLQELETIPFEWGVSDCTTMSAEWVESVLGLSDGLNWPEYGSEEEARRIIDEQGGLVSLWQQKASELSLRRIDIDHEIPSLGDVGIVDTRLSGPIGGIFSQAGFIHVRTHAGTRVLTRNILAAWAVP